MSQTVILVRHGEKPGADLPGAGVDEAGNQDPESLLVRGWQRAGGLAGLIAGGSRGFGRPDRIFASGVFKKDGTGSRSKRPLQTIAPLASKLGLSPIDEFSKGQETALAAALVRLDGVTLVSWQHESIPKIVDAIMGASGSRSWPDARFDLIWILERASAASDWSFAETGQGLLAGDAGAP